MNTPQSEEQLSYATEWLKRGRSTSVANLTADDRKVADVDLRALIQTYEHQAKGGVALAPFPREVLKCLTELAGRRGMLDATGHVIGHPSNCRVNNGMDMYCSCGLES